VRVVKSLVYALFTEKAVDLRKSLNFVVNIVPKAASTNRMPTKDVSYRFRFITDKPLTFTFIFTAKRHAEIGRVSGLKFISVYD